jgi:hypothetical protein
VITSADAPLKSINSPKFVFYLRPKDGDSSDSSWQATYLDEGCWIEAETEGRARARVEAATLRLVERKLGKPKVVPPWRNSLLVECLVRSPPRQIPAGKILLMNGETFDA